jgi:hypothetical protein
MAKKYFENFDSNLMFHILGQLSWYSNLTLQFLHKQQLFFLTHIDQTILLDCWPRFDKLFMWFQTNR